MAPRGVPDRAGSEADGPGGASGAPDRPATVRPLMSMKPWLHGRKPGDRRVRVERPHAEFFRYTGPGTFVAREAASRPRTSTGRAIERIRHALFGRPLSIHEEITERLSKKKALAIFSSDPISSSAYATEEILRVLVLVGAGALVVAAALLLDYVMTVAVSTASAAEQVISAVPDLASFQVAIGVVAITLITLGNMRGLRESGNIDRKS